MFVRKISELRDHIQQRTNGKCHPHWNWLCVKLLSILAKYPSGVSRAIILAEIQQSWSQFHQSRGSQQQRELTVSGICQSRQVGRQSVLEAVVDNVQTVEGTHTKIAVLRDDGYNQTLDMYLHQKLYEQPLAQRKLKFTGCRLLQGTRNERICLLPTENVAIIADSDHEFPPNLCNLQELDEQVGGLGQPSYGPSVRLEVADLGQEETVHLANGETAVKRNVTVWDSDCVHASLVLWDDHVTMANLFKAGDTLAFLQPFVVPSPVERYTLEYGPASLIHCLSGEQEWEVVPSQVNTQCTPISVSRDSQGVLDFLAYPERIFIADHRVNMSHVTVFCWITEVSAKELVKIGSKFELKIEDGTGPGSILINDHKNLHWDGLHPGQCIVLDGVNCCESRLSLHTQHGGRIWNVSSLAGWLSTRFLSSPVPLAEATDHSNCVCRAVISGVCPGTNFVRRTHMTCGREVTGANEQSMVCTPCGVSSVMENPHKPGLEKSLSQYWQWSFDLVLTLNDGCTSIDAWLTQQAAQELLQLPSAQFATHVNKETHQQFLDALLDTQYLFGLSYFHGKFQIDVVSLLSEP